MCEHVWIVYKKEPEWDICILCGYRRKYEDSDIPFEGLDLSDISLIEEIEDKVFIEQRLSELSPRQKEVAFLVLEGWRERDIAKKLGITQGNVSRLLKRARHILNQKVL